MKDRGKLIPVFTSDGIQLRIGDSVYFVSDDDTCPSGTIVIGKEGKPIVQFNEDTRGRYNNKHLKYLGNLIPKKNYDLRKVVFTQKEEDYEVPAIGDNHFEGHTFGGDN